MSTWNLGVDVLPTSSNEKNLGSTDYRFLINGKRTGESIYYGTCSTAAGTTPKAVTIADLPAEWTVVTGTIISIKFTNSNTVASPYLKINSNEATHQIYIYGSTVAGKTAATSWQAGSVVTLIFDGSGWQITNWLNNDTNTYVQQNAVITTANAYPVILAYSTATTKVTNTVNKCASFTYNPSTNALITGGSVDGVSLATSTNQFTVTGSSKTLTVTKSYTLGDACAKGVIDNSTGNGVALSTGTDLVTERAVYYGLVLVNGSSQNRSTTIYVPTSGGTSGQFLKSGGTGAPSWSDLPTASTSGTGIVQLSSTYTANNETYAMTSKGVWDAMTDSSATLTIGQQSKVAGETFSLDTMKADLGLSSAFVYKGTTSSLPPATDATVFANYDNGNVIIVTSGNDAGVYVYNKGVNAASSQWDKLGDSVSYKIMQEPVSSPSADANTPAIAFIDTITQDVNGKITPTKKTIPTASSSVLGLIKIGDTLTINSNTGIADVNITPSDIGAPVIPITTTLTLSNAAGSTDDTITASGSILGVNANMTIDYAYISNPSAVLSEISVTTGNDSVSISADIAAGTSTNITVKLSEERFVSST